MHHQLRACVQHTHPRIPLPTMTTRLLLKDP
jgi:hypothetical protein